MVVLTASSRGCVFQNHADPPAIMQRQHHHHACVDFPAIDGAYRALHDPHTRPAFWAKVSTREQRLSTAVVLWPSYCPVYLPSPLALARPLALSCPTNTVKKISLRCAGSRLFVGQPLRRPGPNAGRRPANSGPPDRGPAATSTRRGTAAVASEASAGFPRHGTGGSAAVDADASGPWSAPAGGGAGGRGGGTGGRGRGRRE